MENKLNKVSMIENGSDISNNIVRVIKGSIFAILISLLFLVIYACVLAYTNISETTMVPVVIVITGISILIGSSISALKIKKQGMLNGALVGLIYMIVLYMLSSVMFTGFSLDLKSICMIATGILTGMIGGIIGVNLK